MAIVRFHGPLAGAVNQFERLRGEIDRVFSDTLNWNVPRGSSGVFPAVNVYEGKDSYLVTAELPSVRAEDVEITVSEDTLSLKGERKPDDGGKNAGYHRRERTAGYFSRVVGLPNKVNPDKVEASATHGVLFITLPKAEHVRPRQIQVKVGN